MVPSQRGGLRVLLAAPDAGGDRRAGALPLLGDVVAACGVASSSQAAEAAGRLVQGCLWVQPCGSRQEGGPGRPC